MHSKLSDWWELSYTIRIPSLKFVGLQVPKIWLIFGYGLVTFRPLNGVTSHSCHGFHSCQFSACYTCSLEMRDSVSSSVFNLGSGRDRQTDRQTVTINALCPTLISVSFNTPKGSASHTKKTLKWNTKKQTQCTATTGTGQNSCRHTRQTYEPSVIYDVADRVSYVRCDVVEHQ